MLSTAALLAAETAGIHQIVVVTALNPTSGLTIDEPADRAEVTAQVVVIRGSTEPDAEVRLNLKDKKDPTFYADEEGRWQYEGKLKQGENNFDFFLQDAKETRAKVSISWKPTLTIESPADGAVVNTERVLVRGLASAGTEVRLNVKREGDSKFQADDTGRWAHRVKLKEGKNTFDFFLQDAKKTRAKRTIVYDPEAAPTRSEVLEVNPTSGLTISEPADGAELTAQVVVIRGSAKPDAEIRLKLKDKKDPTFYADEEGRWEYEAQLKQRENNFDFFLQDSKEKRAEVSIIWKPALSIESPADGAVVNAERVLVRGLTSAGTEVRLNVRRAGDPKFRADDSGRWQHRVKLKEGKNTFDFFLQDAKKTRAKRTILYDPEAAPGTATEAQESEAAKAIVGLTAVDVTGNLENRGLSCGGPNQLETLAEWTCSLSEGGVEYDVQILGNGPTSIQSVNATFFDYEGEVDLPLASDFLGFLATLPYDSAEPEQAREWVRANLGAGGELVIGSAKFILFGAERAKTLQIVAASTVTPDVPQTGPAPPTVDTGADTLRRWLFENFGGAGDPNLATSWYPLITQVAIDARTAAISTNIFPDDEGRQIARTICRAVLFTTAVELDAVRVLGQGGGILDACAR